MPVHTSCWKEKDRERDREREQQGEAKAESKFAIYSKIRVANSNHQTASDLMMWSSAVVAHLYQGCAF